MRREGVPRSVGDRSIPFAVFFAVVLGEGIVVWPLWGYPTRPEALWAFLRGTLGVDFETMLLIFTLIPATATWFVASGLCIHRRSLLYSRASVGGVAGLLLGLSIVGASYVLIWGITLYIVPAGLAALLARWQHGRDLRRAHAMTRIERELDVKT